MENRPLRKWSSDVKFGGSTHFSIEKSYCRLPSYLEIVLNSYTSFAYLAIIYPENWISVVI